VKNTTIYAAEKRPAKNSGLDPENWEY